MVVKDPREVGYGMEADIEISVGKMKGLEKIKIYGPSKSPTKKNHAQLLSQNILIRIQTFQPSCQEK